MKSKAWNTKRKKRPTLESFSSCFKTAFDSRCRLCWIAASFCWPFMKYSELDDSANDVTVSGYSATDITQRPSFP